MTLVVPPEGITIKDRFFKTDTITQPNEAIDREAGKFPVIGLYAPEFMGSVLVGVTSGPSVKVEVGDRQGSNALNGGLFSLQAPPSQAAPSASSDLTDRIRRTAWNFRPFARRDDGNYGDLKAEHRRSIERRRTRILQFKA